MAIISENRRNTPQYQQNGARRNQALGLPMPKGQRPTDPRAAFPTAGRGGGSAALEPQIAPPTNYDQLFRQSIDTQRGAIDAQLRSAMSSLGEREARANGLIALQPGEVNANFDAAMPEIQKAAQASAATQAALNITPLAGDQSGIEPIQAALAQARAGALADQPYLQAGTQDLYQRQRGALDTAAIEARSALDAQQQDYYQQQALQDRQEKQQENSLFNELMIRRQFSKMDQADEARAKSKEERKMLDASEPPQGTAEWWTWYMRRHPNKAQSMLSAHGNGFANAKRLMGQGEVTAGDTSPWGQALRSSMPGGIANAATSGRGVGSVKGTPFDKLGRNKLTLQEVLKRYSGPGYARLRAALMYQAGKGGRG